MKKRNQFDPDKIPDAHLSPVLILGGWFYREYVDGSCGPSWGCARGILQHFDLPEGMFTFPRFIQFAACPFGHTPPDGTHLYADAVEGADELSGLLLEPTGSEYRTDDGRLLSVWVGEINKGDPLWEWVKECNAKGWCRFILLCWDEEDAP